MALLDLVEYFNDRLEREHRANYRPLVIVNEQVIGLFGQLSISSNFLTLRQAANPNSIAGHTVKMEVTANEIVQLQSYEIERLAANSDDTDFHFESAINFDRLVRTVHLLNYLPLAHPEKTLFLDVDPLHILGIKKDHGAYFEKVIERCGLTTQNTVMVLRVSGGSYLTYSDALIRGLSNYRQHGYKIAVDFSQLIADQHAFELIRRLSPDYVCLSARHIQSDSSNKALQKLHSLKQIITETHGKGVLREIDSETSKILANDSGFDLVEGSYYDHLLSE